MNLLIRALKPFGYYIEHEAGEVFSIPLQHVTELIQEGLIEIVVNNKGNNLDYDEDLEFDFYEKVDVIIPNKPTDSEVPQVCQVVTAKRKVCSCGPVKSSIVHIDTIDAGNELKTLDGFLLQYV